MMSTPVETAESRALGFDYFMLRVEREPEADSSGPNGTIERLGTGDKQEFAGVSHLLQLLTGWRQSNWKMRRPDDPGNGAPPAPVSAHTRLD